ncbi:MAG TPA: maleylpyruvate isomerase N-terminal domain-containing protein [Candidatus Limnocylindria bacterium]|nr:maleylpyruvate isomerase N-terminal domain-containing protein [Candidatus Limnocylindria bacterium]
MSTETLGTSSDLLARVEHVYVSTRSVIDALPAERFDERLPSGMTLREVVAHLAAWEETVPPRVEHALATGSDLGRHEDIDVFNANVFAETRDATVDDLRARLARSHAAVVEIVRSFEHREVPKLALDIVEWNTTGHYPDHFGDFGAAIKDANDLVAVVQQGWTTFRLAVMSLGVSGLERTSPAGWTYKAMVAHCAGWERLTVTRLRTLREAGTFELSGVQTDEFNAKMAEDAASRDVRDVLEDLQTAHAELVAEIGKLSPQQIHANDDWAIAVVAGNSYGHYGEHHAELFAAVPTRPAELLELMREGWRSFRGTLSRVGLLPLSHTTSAGWTAKALLAHLAYWLESVGASLPERLAGRRGRVPDIEAENARERAGADARTAHEIVGRLDRAYREVVRLVEALPPDEDIHFMAVRLIAGETYGHFAGHLRELAPFIPTTTAGVLRRFDESWSALRARVREVGRAGLGDTTPAGWTYRDCLAHLANWMQNAASELESGASPAWNAETIQAENDRAVAAHRLVGPEAMLDELDSSHRRVRDVIAGLSDERIRDRRVFDVVAFYTYLAWEEHFEELGITV